jgi:hypothetical protein
LSRAPAVGEVAENYLRPVHHERMELREWQEADNLLDLYNLRCTRCDQTVKLSSVTQLDADFESYRGNGLFGAG